MRKLLVEALKKGGAVLRRRLGNAKISYKGRANPVTEADLESQRTILRLISRRFPGHGYFAEEDARKPGRITWVIDPLDGTTNFAHGYPMFTVSIAAVEGREPLVGGVYDPIRDELFLAEKGKGATLNGRPLKVTSTARLSDALLVTGFGYDRAERASFYCGRAARFLRVCHDLRRSGSAALDLAWLAAGRHDGYWERTLKPWDVAAGLLLVREAGGKVTDFSGKAWTTLDGFGAETLASNGRIHDAMRRTLK